MIARTLLLTAVVSSGLMAGLFFAWMVSVIPGTARVSDLSYIDTMQAINRAIVNPWFVVPFVVTPLLLAGAAALEWRAGNTRRAWFLLGAAVSYVLGVLAVTVGGNIPLNNELDAFDLTGSPPASVAEMRDRYEGPWNRWHAVRTVVSIASFVGAVWATTISTES